MRKFYGGFYRDKYKKKKKKFYQDIFLLFCMGHAFYFLFFFYDGFRKLYIYI